MRILIVGDDPKNLGGVVNYTRPLASEFSRMGHDVFYFFSGAWNKKYDLRFRTYLKVDKSTFQFQTAEVINPPMRVTNFTNPTVDMSCPPIERVFEKYLRATKPEVMHVHDIVGLPSSINEIAHHAGVRVLNTFHVYGYLCQRRVTLNHLKEFCPGPFDLRQCGVCTNEATDRYYFFKQRLRNLSPSMFDSVVSARKKGFSAAGTLPREDLSEGDVDQLLVDRLNRRLAYNMHVLNHFSELNICVSNDVKKKMTTFGLMPGRSLVQHIGSVIAGRSIDFPARPLAQKKIVFGNIGGVEHYKGTHLLLKAFSRLDQARCHLKIVGKYNREYVDGLLAATPGLSVEFTGHYRPSDLPELVKDIDMMVLPSIVDDTAPQTIFESYACGIPLVAPRIGGFTDFVNDGINGFLFRAGDVEDLTSKLTQIICKPEIIATFHSKLPKLKKIEENAQELCAIYKALIDKDDCKKAQGL